MERVFDNLIRNAINYSYPNSSLRLAISESDDILIRLTNQGKTIPAEKIGLILSLSTAWMFPEQQRRVGRSWFADR